MLLFIGKQFIHSLLRRRSSWPPTLQRLHDLASQALFWNGKPMVWVDMKKLEEHARAIDTSVMAE
jgi:hypothetical protein